MLGEGKRKIVPVLNKLNSTPLRRTLGLEVQLHHRLLHYVEMSDQLEAPAALTFLK
jgi:hypothetical protein